MKYPRITGPLALGLGTLASCALMFAAAPAANAVETDDAGPARHAGHMAHLPYVGARLVVTADGVIVAHVDEGGPVDDAGIAEGDTVVSIDGIDLDERGALREALADAEAGTDLVVAYVHDGKSAKATVTVGAPEDRPAAPALADIPWVGAGLVHYEAGDGVLVRQVDADGPADAAGLAKGDVVTEVDGTAVTEWYEVQEILRDHAPGDSVELTVVRDGDTMTVMVTLGSAADAPARPMGDHGDRPEGEQGERPMGEGPAGGDGGPGHMGMGGEGRMGGQGRASTDS